MRVRGQSCLLSIRISTKLADKGCLAKNSGFHGWPVFLAQIDYKVLVVWEGRITARMVIIHCWVFAMLRAASGGTCDVTNPTNYLNARLAASFDYNSVIYYPAGRLFNNQSILCDKLETPSFGSLLAAYSLFGILASRRGKHTHGSADANSKT